MEQEQIYSNYSLFVGDLAQFSSETELHSLFSTYGEVSEVRIMRNSTTKKPLCYGFVTFLTTEGASDALKSLNNTPFHGRNLRIGWAAHNFQVQKKEEGVVNSLYIRFSSPQVEVLVTEETLHSVFDQYNNVIDASIKKTVCDKDLKVQSGYGFVHFTSDQAGIASAFHALSEVHNTTVNNVTYNVEASKNLLKQFKDTSSSSSSSIKSTTKPQSKAVHIRTQLTNSFDSTIPNTMLGHVAGSSYIGLNDTRQTSGLAFKPSGGHSRTPSNESVLSTGSGNGYGNSGMHSAYAQQQLQQRSLGNAYTALPPPSIARSSSGGVYPPRPNLNVIPPAGSSVAYKSAGQEYGSFSPYAQSRSLPSAGGSTSNPLQYPSSMGNDPFTHAHTQQASSQYNQAPLRSYSHMNPAGKEGMLYARPQDPLTINRTVPSHPSQHRPTQLYQQQHQPFQQQQPQQQQQRHQQPNIQLLQHLQQQQQLSIHEQPYRQSSYSIPSSQRSAHSIPSSCSRSTIPPSLPLPVPPPRLLPAQGHQLRECGGSVNANMPGPHFPNSIPSRVVTDSGRGGLSLRGIESGYGGFHHGYGGDHQAQTSGRSFLDNRTVNQKNMGVYQPISSRVSSNAWPHSAEATASMQRPYFHNIGSVGSNSTDLDDLYSSSRTATHSSDEYTHSPQSLTAFLRSANTDIGISSNSSGSIDRSGSHDLSQFPSHSVGQQSDSILSQKQVIDLQDLDLSAWVNRMSSSSSDNLLHTGRHGPIGSTHSSTYGTTDSESGLYSSAFSGSAHSGRSLPSIPSMAGTKTIGPSPSSTATSNPSYSNAGSHGGDHQQTNMYTNTTILQQPLPNQQLDHTDNSLISSLTGSNQTVFPAEHGDIFDYSPNPSFQTGLETTMSSMVLNDLAATSHNNNNHNNPNPNIVANNHFEQSNNTKKNKNTTM